MTWRDQSACKGKPHAWFFPEEGVGQGISPFLPGLRVCAVCPVRQECGQFAVENKVRWGLWGGLTPKDRGWADGKRIRGRKAA